MNRQGPRIPSNCPPAFQGRYTVRRGDTFFRIAQIFRTRFEALAVNNPHIPDPNIIFPGDILCVPSLVPFPCCVALRERLINLPFGIAASAFVHLIPAGTVSVSIVGTLPNPMMFGNFNTYEATVFIPDVGGFGDILMPVPDDPPTWARRIDFPTAAQLTPNSRIVIQPANTQTGANGPIILEGNLRNCGGRCPEC
jgi:hypothetical protein